MLENKLHISNKSSIAIKLSLLVAILIASAVFIANVAPIFANGTDATIWTTDYLGNDKTDFGPGEIVYVHGTGFNPTSQIYIDIIRPDSTIESCHAISCNLRFLNGLQTSDTEGDFLYQYDLDGITGEYSIDITDGINSGHATFTDARTINSATLNGGSSVIVPSSTSITAAVTVTTSGSSSANDWESTSYLIEGGSWICVDTPDHTQSGTHTESFNINAPSNPGVYDVSFRAYLDDSCSYGESSKYTLTDGITVTSPAVCGNSDIETPETCDDGNTNNGDGCNSICKVESGWTCNGEPSICAEVCGNGIITQSEECDDKNTANNDGCNNACVIESGWTCSGQPSICKAVNPTLPSSCGIDMVLIIDSSGSITDPPYLTNMKNAFKGFVDAFLPNTPTQIAVVDFDTIATLTQDYTSDKVTIKNAIDSATSGGYTNWEDAFVKAHNEYDNRIDKPDLYVFASDGNPNRIGSGQSASESAAVAAAVTQANHIKLSGIRIITLGIGSSVNSANLIAISSADAYYSTGFDTLAQTLAALADDLCGGTVTVKKLVGEQPASGWEFSTSVTGGTSTPSTSTTDTSGFINPVFDIEIQDTTATVDVTETSQQGYGFVSAHCYKDQQEVGTPGQGTVTEITVGKNDAIYCEFQNTQQECVRNEDCYDGFYCNGLEYCDQNNECQQGTSIDCSSNNIDGIATCDNDPDVIHFTWDSRGAFTSECIEAGSNQGYCTSGDSTITHTCSVQDCGAECDQITDCQDMCKGDVRYSSGSCDLELCGCSYAGVEDCSKNDGWYRTGKTQWVTDTECTEKEQAEEEYRDYSCDPAGCKHIVTNTQWVDTGQTKPKVDGTICGSDPFGMCDIQDTCQVGVCVSNVMSKGTECRPAAGNCDAAEVCDGVSQFCPSDSFLPDTVECRAQNGPCDVADYCTGQNPTCLIDAIQPEGYICEYDKGQCEANDICDGQTKVCNEKYVPLSTSCDNGIFCDGSDHCDGNGACTNLGPSIICDDQDQCTIDTCNEERDECAYTFTDKVGPTTSDLLVDPYYNNGVFNVAGLATDTCSNIKKSEYFVGRGLGSCGFVGTGAPMDPTDGSFDEKIEDIKKNNVQYIYDGLNYICIQSQDFAENWGNCACAYYDTDIIPPECPYDIYLDKTLYPDEYLVCGNNTWINATVCDEQSPIQGGEYFLDTKIPPIPAPWSGIWMNVLSSFARPSDNHNCAVIGAFVDTSKLTDGTHYIKLRGKDSVENWGKIDSCMNVSFIRDTTSPETAKTLTPFEGEQHVCEAGEITTANLLNGVSLTNGCQFVKGGTQVVLHATDPDPQGTDEHADKTKISWIVWYKVNPEDQWVIDQQGVGNENQDVTITLDKDSYHLIEYWSVDACGWEETHHFELDIVDNKSPVTTKTIGEPKILNTAGELYITQQTPIELSCVDQLPHPVDHVTLYARYNVDGGNWVDLLTKDGYVKFTFPEDSIHTLEWYCEDALGNKELTSTEIDRVDTTYPDTVKTYGTPLVEAVTGGYPKWITSQTPITLTATDGGAICAIGVDKTYWRNTLVDERYCADQSLCQEAEPVQPNLVINEIYYDTPGIDMDSFIELFGPANFDLDGYKVVGINGVNGLEYNSIILDGYKTDENGFFFITIPSSIYVGIADMVTPDADFQNGPDAIKLVKTGDGDITVDLLGYGMPLTPDLYETQSAIDVSSGFSLSRNDAHVDTNNNALDFIAGAPTPKSGNSAPKWNEYLEPFYKPEESCHLIEYYSIDSLGNTEPVKKQCVYVENTPPEIVKTIDTPKHECTLDEKTQYGNPDYGCWYITQNTKITLDCDDVMPHPVDNVVLYYRDYLLGEIAPSYTAVQGGYVDIYKTEDSEHVLEFYCVDALGNSQGTAENPHKEIDIIDTKAPISSKAVGEPKHACTQAEVSQYYTVPTMPSDGCYFINQSTPITLTCADQSPHPVDHVKLYYRYFSSDLSQSGHCVGTPGPICPILFPPCNSCEELDYNTCADAGCHWELINFTEVIDDEVTISPGEDSAHVLQWYCVDELGNTESLHEEYDIVDTEAPSIVKSIVGPSYGDCLPTETDDQCFIDGVTKIHVESRDPSWHPSDHVTCEWDYTVTDGTKIGTGQTGVVPPFDINFPEESTHVLTIKCKDALGNEETDVEKFIVDKTPPTTTKTYGTPLVEAVTGGYPKWINSSTPITLTVDDTGVHKSGIKETKYRVTLLGGNEPCEDNELCQEETGSGSWSDYTTPFTIGQESCHLIEYYSVDNVDKTEIVKKQCVYVDNTPPEVSKEVGTPKVESIETTEYKPQESYDVKDRAWFVNQSTPITLTCTDPLPHPVDQVKIYYKIYNDGQLIQGWTLYTSPFTYGEDTYHELYYYCVDALGNKGLTHYQLDIVDTQPPVSQKTFDGTSIPCSQLACANEPSCDYYITQDTKIELTCSDLDPHPVNDVKIYYRYFVDDLLHQDWTLYESPIQYNENSKHTLDWYCVDALGNIEGTHTQIERVDSTPPVTTKTVGDPKYGNDDYWVTSQTPITLTTLDNEIPCASGPATLYYEVWWDSNCDGTIDTKVQSDSVTTDTNCKLEKTIYLNEECLHEIRWHAVDALGNVEREHTQLHKVDNTAPHVLILKPVDGWYSDGEDVSIVSVAEDLTNPHTPCTDPLSGKCAVGIEDGRQCYAYLIDLLPEFKIVELNTDGTFLYNAEAHECQGYATIPSESGIPDGVTLLAVSVDDNLENMGNSLQEIYHAIMMNCGDGQTPECIMNVVQDIITIWNLPKIGIDNHAPEVTITTPIEGTLFGGEQVYFSANVIDSNDGDVTSTITSGTPCYITVGGISLGTVPYNNENRKCTGTIMIPEDTDFPQGTQTLKIEIADNAGNLGSDEINVNVDTVVPTLSIIIPAQNQFVKGTLQVTAQVSDTNLDTNSIQISTDNGQTWDNVWYCNPSTYCYDWDTAQETDGMAYGILAKATDFAENTGYSEVVIVIVDNGSPEGVYIVNPIKNDIVEGTITLKVLATDYVSGVESVKIYVESVAWYCDAILTDGTWQCSFDSAIKNDGNHEVYAVATDSLGQTTTSAHVPFIIDNNPPSTPTLSVADTDGDGYDTDGVVTWSWTISTDDGSGIAYYEFEASDKPGDVITKVIGNFFTVSDLIQGTYTARIRSVDKAGHASAWSNGVTITIDTIKPTNVLLWKDETKEDFYYDMNGHYHLYWNGGDDTNFDQYELFENDVSIYTGADKTIEFNDKGDGIYTYYITALDDAGWSTISNKIKVVVDKQEPDIQITGTIPGIGFFIATYSVSDPSPSSGFDKIVSSTDGYALCSGTFPTGFCTVFLGSKLDLTAYDKAGNSDTASTTGTEKDIIPPTITYSSPSGVIDDNTIILEVKTDEPSTCHYGSDDNNETMTLMTADVGKTAHTANLGTLTDGLKVYHVVCEDMTGNKMDSSKTIVFYIDTTGSYELVIPDYGHYWSTGWNSFFLPEDMLEDICGNGKPYTVEKILSSLDGSDPSYDVLWYFDGTDWLYYNPKDPSHSTLTQFNDNNSLPYYIRLVREDRLEISQANCQLDL